MSTLEDRLEGQAELIRQRIDKYWRERGYRVNAQKYKSIHHRGQKHYMTLWEIKTDTLNGWPVRR